jgi:hypothetical protein
MQDANPSPESSDRSFERLKFWVDLAKWFLVSIVLVVITMVIDTGLKDRTQGINEISAYDKYVTDLVVLNKEVGPRRLLAQYFANVTPSDKLRERWKDYYVEVNKEYQLIAAHDSSLARKQHELLLKKNLTRTDSVQLEEIDLKRSKYDQQLNAPVTPIDATVERPADPSTASAWEAKGIDHLARRDVAAAVHAFQNAEASYNGYHSSYEIARYLKQQAPLLTGPDSAQAWQGAIKHINTNLSWGMPRDKKMLLERAK